MSVDRHQDYDESQWCRRARALGGFICTQSMHLCTHPMHDIVLVHVQKLNSTTLLGQLYVDNLHPVKQLARDAAAAIENTCSYGSQAASNYKTTPCCHASL